MDLLESYLRTKHTRIEIKTHYAYLSKFCFSREVAIGQSKLQIDSQETYLIPRRPIVHFRHVYQSKLPKGLPRYICGFQSTPGPRTISYLTVWCEENQYRRHFPQTKLKVKEEIEAIMSLNFHASSELPKRGWF